MQRCLDLAALGLGNVSPNPMVGAVIVHDGKIIGEGYHQQFGKAHAEVHAIEAVLTNYPDAEERFKTATLYVSLEPCSHFGKTPPCADLILRHGIPLVVVGCRDPFDAVNGKGIEKLRAHGVQVIEDVLKDRCYDLNKRFFTRVKLQRPYIILKWAKTADGYFAAINKQKWISGPEAKALVNQWRSEEDAVLVGKNTALLDNPQLNVREWTGKNPKRLVIDRNLELPKELHIFDQSVETLVFNSIKTDVDGKVKYLEVEDFDNYLPQLIAFQLYIMDVQSIIVEGGAQTLNLFIKAGLWDEARIFTSPQIWNEGVKSPILALPVQERYTVGQDTLEISYNR